MSNHLLLNVCKNKECGHGVVRVCSINILRGKISEPEKKTLLFTLVEVYGKFYIATPEVDEV